MSSLFLLLASLNSASPSHLNVEQRQAFPFQSPTSPTSTDLHLIQDTINKVLSGSLEVDEQSIVGEYGVIPGLADTRSHEMLKRALSIEALLYCIENCPGPAEWILQSTIEVLFTPDHY